MSGEFEFMVQFSRGKFCRHSHSRPTRWNRTKRAERPTKATEKSQSSKRISNS